MGIVIGSYGNLVPKFCVSKYKTFLWGTSISIQCTLDGFVYNIIDGWKFILVVPCGVSISVSISISCPKFNIFQLLDNSNLM